MSEPGKSAAIDVVVSLIQRMTVIKVMIEDDDLDALDAAKAMKIAFDMMSARMAEAVRKLELRKGVPRE